jgi:hypothetical protein
MAMEIFALSDQQLNSLTDWQRAIDFENYPFPLRLSDSRGIAQLSGFLPVQYDGGRSGFECDHWDPREIADTYPNSGLERRWTYALAFRFGGRRGELECAWMAATAYARATAGVVFDTGEAKVFTPDQGAALVRTMEGNRAVRAKYGEEIRRRLFPDRG